MHFVYSITAAHPVNMSKLYKLFCFEFLFNKYGFHNNKLNHNKL